MLPLKAVAFVGCVNRLDNLRMAVPQGIGGPPTLKIDIAVIIQVPDIIALGAADNHLGGGVVTLAGCILRVAMITQTIA